MPARLTFAVCLLAALLPINAGAQQPDLTWPQWLKDAMAKESKPRKGKQLETEDGLLTHIVGKPSEPENIDSGWYFASDIKAQSPLECYAFTQAMDLATLTNIVAETNIEAVSDNYGAIANRSIYYTDAGAIGRMPYLALEWFYTAGEGDNTVVGFTKVRAATRGDLALACAHNVVGYRETFEKAFVTFVESTQYDDGLTEPYYEEIALIRVGGDPQGVGVVSYTVDEYGDTRIYRSEASLTPMDAQTLSTSDITAVTYSTPDGAMINSYEQSVENGEVTTEFSLRRNEDNNWSVSGTMQQKPIDATIDGERSPATELGQLAAARALFAEDNVDVNMDLWIASIDPTQFVDARMVRDDAEVTGQAILELGPIAYTGRFDDYGNMIEAKMTFGPVIVEIERIWSRGELPK